MMIIAIIGGGIAAAAAGAWLKWATRPVRLAYRLGRAAGSGNRYLLIRTIADLAGKQDQQREPGLHLVGKDGR